MYIQHYVVYDWLVFFFINNSLTKPKRKKIVAKLSEITKLNFVDRLFVHCSNYFFFYFFNCILLVFIITNILNILKTKDDKIH